MEAPVHQEDADGFLISLFLKKELKLVVNVALSQAQACQQLWGSFFNFGDTSAAFGDEIPLKALAWFTEFSQKQVKQGHERMVYYRFTNTERIVQTEL